MTASAEITDGAMVIRLILDGALPHPARCVACGYSGNERYYFFFKYKEKWGQVLLCTTCMNEAASLPDTDFVSMKSHNALLDELISLRKKNERLAGILANFRSQFDSIVDDLVVGLDHANEDIPVDEISPPIDTPVAEPERPVETFKFLEAIGDAPVNSDAGDDGTSFDAEQYEPDLESISSVIDKPFGEF